AAIRTTRRARVGSRSPAAPHRASARCTRWSASRPAVRASPRRAERVRTTRGRAPLPLERWSTPMNLLRLLRTILRSARGCTLVRATRNGEVDPNIRLPASDDARVCYVEMSGMFSVSGPPGGPTITADRAFALFRDQPLEQTPATAGTLARRDGG